MVTAERQDLKTKAKLVVAGLYERGIIEFGKIGPCVNKCPNQTLPLLKGVYHDNVPHGLVKESDLSD